MDENENSAIIEAILRGDDHPTNLNHHQNQDSGWKTVSYTKRRKNPPKNSVQPASTPFPNSNVFSSIDQHSEDRLRRAKEAAAAAAAAAAAIQSAVRSKQHSDDDDDSGAENSGGAVENWGAEEAKKVKPKKPKKPKVSVGEAASKMDADDLAAFLLDISVSYNFEILLFDSVFYTLICCLSWIWIFLFIFVLKRRFPFLFPFCTRLPMKLIKIYCSCGSLTITAAHLPLSVQLNSHG